jgi:hypothetical protein
MDVIKKKKYFTQIKIYSLTRYFRYFIKMALGIEIFIRQSMYNSLLLYKI